MTGFHPRLQTDGRRSGEFLTFPLDSDLYAVEAAYVSDVNNMLTVVPIPDTPQYCSGIVRLKHKIVPVIDMRLKLSKQPGAYGDQTSIIVLNIEGAQAGLIVDEVSEVVRISEETIVPFPMDVSSNRRYFQGVGQAEQKAVWILDCKELLQEDGILDLAHIVS